MAASSRRSAKSLVALSAAAVLSVYAAGYVRTRAAAERFTGEAAQRRTAAPIAIIAEAPTPPSPSVEPPTRIAAPAPAAPKKKAAGVEPRPTPPPAAAVQAPAEPAVTTPVTPVIPESERKAVEPPPPPAVKPPSPYKDGTYSGWGTSRHGDIQATVVIEGGRIASASISQCLTRYSCSWIAALPPQVAARQSAEVDFVSGATQSTNAFYYAVLEALAKAK